MLNTHPALHKNSSLGPETRDVAFNTVHTRVNVPRVSGPGLRFLWLTEQAQQFLDGGARREKQRSIFSEISERI